MTATVPIPDGLAALPPGPELAAALAGVDLSLLSGWDCVEVLKAQSRQVNHERARLMAAMVETGLCDVGPDDQVRRVARPGEFAPDEVRAALVLTRRAAEHQFWPAYDLRTRLPAVHSAMDSGRLDEPRARILAEWTEDLTGEQARAVCAGLLPRAGELTTGQLIELIKKRAIALDPEWARRRYESAVADRKGRRFAQSRRVGEPVRYQSAPGPGRRRRRPYRRPRPCGEERRRCTPDRPHPPISSRDDRRQLHGTRRRHHSRPAPAPRARGSRRARRGSGTRRDRNVVRDLIPTLTGARWVFAITGTDGRLLHTGITRRRPAGSPREARSRHLVELQIPETLLRALAARDDIGPWAPVLADLARQHAHRVSDPYAGDTDRRVPGAALRRHLQIRDRTCVGPGCRATARSRPGPHDRPRLRRRHDRRQPRPRVSA